MAEKTAPTQDPVFQSGLAVANLLKRYHRYEVRGLEHIPKAGAALIAVSHSLATYDSLLLGSEIYLKRGRYPAALADRRIFQTPGIGQFFSMVGAVEGSPDAGQKLLGEGNLLIVSPGGMRESLRPSSKKYRVEWEGRLGFVRLAIKSQVPVILAACPAADDIYTLYENPLTPAIYKNFKWPAPLLRGLGLSLIPRPVKLVHYVSQPFVPPALRKGAVDESDVREFHEKLKFEMLALMQK